MLIAAPTATGPGWTDILTAIGTVGAVVAAVGIALWTEFRSGERIKAEHERSDRLLRHERERAASDLAEQREHEKAAIEEERRLAVQREQLAEAYAVQVVLAERAGGTEAAAYGNPTPSGTTELAVMVVNTGSYTITEVDARFCLGSGSGDLVFSARSKRLTGYKEISERLRYGWAASAEHALDGVLTPRDAGVRFESYTVPVAALSDPYPVVRWTDRWGTRWEHKKGVVMRVRDDEPWEP
jgi:hypothetical protein